MAGRKVFALFGVIGLEGAEGVFKNLNAIDKRAKELSRQLNKTGNQINKLGKSFTKSLTVPIVAAGAAVVKFGGDFEKAMSKSLAIMGDVSDTMKSKMSKSAREVAKVSTISAKESADAYYYLASAGMTAEQSLSALPKVAKFAEAGQFDMALATDLLTDAQSALGLSTKNVIENERNLVHVSDVLVKANTLANASVQQFSEALTNRAGAALRVVGKSVEEGVAVLAAYADQGTKGAEAGTQLGIVMRDLQKAAIGNKAAFDKNKVSVFDSSGEMRNMADILHDLETALAGMSDEQKKTILSTMDFQEKSVASLLALIGTSEKIREYEKALKSAGGTTEMVAEKQMQNFNDQLKIIKNRVIDVFIGLSTKLLPILKNQLLPIIESGVNTLGRFVDKFNGLPQWIQETALKAVMLTAAIGPLLLGLGGLLKMIASIRATFILLNAVMFANPVVLITVGVVALTAALISMNRSQNASIEKLKQWNEEAEYSVAIQKAMREEWEKNPMFDSAKFKKEFKERWKEYNDGATNSYEQLAQTKSVYDKRENESNAEVAKKKVELTDEQLEDKIKALELEIEQEEETSAIIQQIDEDLTNDKKASLEELKRLSIQYDQDKIKSAKYASEENRRLNDEESSHWRRLFQDKLDRIKEEKNLKINAGFQAFNILSQLNTNSDIAEDNRYKKEKDRIENSLMTEEQKEAALKKIDSEHEKRKGAIRKRQAILDKAAALFDIAINTAVAVVKALPNVVLASIIGGLGAAQGIAVAAQPIPAAEKGAYLPGTSDGTIIRAGEKKKPEIIFPLTTGIDILAGSLVDKLKALVAPMAPQMQMAGGGEINVNVNVNGNFIGNNAAMRDLAKEIGVEIKRGITREGARG